MDINIPKPIRKSVSVLKDKYIILFKTNTPKETVYGRGQKLSKPRKQNIKKPFVIEQNKGRIVRNILKLFETDQEEEQRKESEKRKKQNEKIIKDKIIRDIRTLFE